MGGAGSIAAERKKKFGEWNTELVKELRVSWIKNFDCKFSLSRAEALRWLQKCPTVGDTIDIPKFIDATWEVMKPATTLDVAGTIAALAIMSSGDMDKKVNIIFAVFDFNNQKKLARDELAILFMSANACLCRYSGQTINPAAAASRCEVLANAAFQEAKDGFLSEDGFLRFVTKFLKVFEDKDGKKDGESKSREGGKAPAKSPKRGKGKAAAKAAKGSSRSPAAKKGGRAGHNRTGSSKVGGSHKASRMEPAAKGPRKSPAAKAPAKRRAGAAAPKAEKAPEDDSHTGAGKPEAKSAAKARKAGPTEEESAKAATKIQSVHRGKQGRKKAKDKANVQKENKAATKIQATARGRADRKRVKELLEAGTEGFTAAHNRVQMRKAIIQIAVAGFTRTRAPQNKEEEKELIGQFFEHTKLKLLDRPDSDIAQIANVYKPPMPILVLAGAICVIFGERPTWQKAQKLFRSGLTEPKEGEAKKPTFLARARLIEPGKLTPRVRQIAAKLLNEHKMLNSVKELVPQVRTTSEEGHKLVDVPEVRGTVEDLVQWVGAMVEVVPPELLAPDPEPVDVPVEEGDAPAGDSKTDDGAKAKDGDVAEAKESDAATPKEGEEKAADGSAASSKAESKAETETKEDSAGAKEAKPEAKEGEVKEDEPEAKEAKPEAKEAKPEAKVEQEDKGEDKAGATAEAQEEKKEAAAPKPKVADKDYLPAKLVTTDVPAGTVIFSSGGSLGIVASAGSGCVTVASSKPLTEEAPYFEVRAADIGISREMSVGLCPTECKVDARLGHFAGSVGFNAENGKVFSALGALGIAETEYSSSWKSADVVGCGVDFTEMCVFFTVNGKRLKSAANLRKNTPLWPAVSVCSAGQAFEVNFGASPFVYNPDATADGAGSSPSPEKATDPALEPTAAGNFARPKKQGSNRSKGPRLNSSRNDEFNVGVEPSPHSSSSARVLGVGGKSGSFKR